MSLLSKIGLGYGVGGYGEGYYGGTAVPYYRSLVTSEYQNSPKFLALLSAALQPIDDLFSCLVNMDFAFYLDTAVGAQLDMIGAIVGTKRQVGFQPSNGVSPILDDLTFRVLLKAKVARNHWDGKISSLQTTWKQLFPGGTISIQDNQNMSISVTLSGSFSSIIQDLITNGLIVPRPEGVLVNYVFGTGPFFGFDRNDAYVAGFDTGKFA